MTQRMHDQQQIMMGNMRLFINDDEDFLHGYINGYETFHTYHSKQENIETSMLLFLLRNGWDTGHSDQWNTGYIIGWLAALYEQERGQFALSIDASSTVSVWIGIL